MMTRGKSIVNVAPAASPVSGTRPQKRPAKSTKGSKGAPRSKRAKTSAPSATAVTQDSGHILPHDEHPSQLQRVPLSNAPLPPLQQSAPLKDLAAIISGAVMEGLKVAGIISDVPSDASKADSNQAASVQGSVAAVIHDITGEQTSPSVNQNNTCSNITTHNVSFISDPPVGAIDRPELVHNQMSVPLGSRISDKLQSKIWANEYVDFGTLLERSHANESKYNFIVQASPSADRPVISLEPAQKSKRIATIDQWITAFQTFVAIYTVRFPNDAPALMKYSETVRDLAAKNAHWRYYDENFRFLRQKTLFSWDQIHWELWLQAHHMTKTASAFSSESRNKNSRQPFPSGFCWKFHRGEKCSGCNFKHECFKCGNQHPSNQCTFPSRQKSTSHKYVSRQPGPFASTKSAAASRPVSSTINTN